MEVFNKAIKMIHFRFYVVYLQTHEEALTHTGTESC